MSRLVDYVDREFGKLTVRVFVGTWKDAPHRKLQRHWLCDCSCGGMVKATTEELTAGRIWHCLDCNPESKGADYLSRYQYYRARFSATQWEQYLEILGGRTGRRVEAEAVDLVMRNLVLPRARERDAA